MYTLFPHPQTVYPDSDEAGGEAESRAQPPLTGGCSVHEDTSPLPPLQRDPFTAVRHPRHPPAADLLPPGSLIIVHGG